MIKFVQMITIIGIIIVIIIRTIIIAHNNHHRSQLLSTSSHRHFFLSSFFISLFIRPRYRDSPVVRFLRIDPTASGSDPTSAKLSRRVRRVTLGARIAQW